MNKIMSYAKKYPLAVFVGGMLFAGTAFGIKVLATGKDLKNKVVGA